MCNVYFSKTPENVATNMMANLADLGMLNSTTSPLASYNNTNNNSNPNLNNNNTSGYNISSPMSSRLMSKSGETFDTEESGDERGV